MKTAFIIIDVQNILVETGFQTNSLLEKFLIYKTRLEARISKLSMFNILRILNLKHQKIGSYLGF